MTTFKQYLPDAWSRDKDLGFPVYHGGFLIDHILEMEIANGIQKYIRAKKRWRFRDHPDPDGSLADIAANQK